MASHSHDALKAQQDIEDAGFSLDDLHCIKCGCELDTGYECNGCGFDMLDYVRRMQ